MTIIFKPFNKTIPLRRKRSGQAMIFFMMILIIMAVMVIWNYDLHKILHVKTVSQNGGDSAALAASRWQGISLNLIGDLNIMQAVALTNGDTNTAKNIAMLQSRLSYAGPMVALLASQQAAKNNGIHNNEQFTAYLLEHAEKVEMDYPSQSGPSGDMLFPEPYPDAWQDYADMLYYIAEMGVAAGIDNMALYSDPDGGHMLYNLEFYDAIAGYNWCWFWRNAMNELENYTNWRWWPPLPDLPQADPMNSEFFGLGLTKVRIREDLTEIVNTLREERQLSDVVVSNVFSLSANWFAYNQGKWGDWSVMDPDSFPITGRVKQQYNYSGADAAIRIETEATRVSPADGAHPISWTAAAKPFGYLNETDVPTEADMVLPAFRDVRLIPVDASSAPAGGSYNLDWRDHIEIHLPEYMQRGLAGLTAACPYCGQLRTWENPGFRQTGLAWISTNSANCIVTGGGGGGGGGGTRRGH
jgi:hypothetical protein